MSIPWTDMEPRKQHHPTEGRSIDVHQPYLPFEMQIAEALHENPEVSHRLRDLTLRALHDGHDVSEDTLEEIESLLARRQKTGPDG